MSDLIVCSFHTTDTYYAAAADRLREDLERLDVRYVLEPVAKREGEDWADICRKKVPFLDEVCRANPGARVVWVDVDCRLLDLPDTVTRSSADIVGFARGFSTALNIGYKNRARFWEPCFWGVGPSPQARQMISDAAELERRSSLKATDDYFFEEAWRANADRLSFQVLPSGGALGRGDDTVEAFLVFGASGSVAEFKGKVAQHDKGSSGTAASGGTVRARAYHGVKQVVLRAPDPVIQRAVDLGQRSGVTDWLKRDVGEVGSSPSRARTINSILQAGIDVRPDDLEASVAEISDQLLSNRELHTIDAARGFAAYGTVPSAAVPDATAAPAAAAVPLKWWARPFPGNFGDWLSPYLVSRLTERPVRFVTPTKPASVPHLIAVGSIGRYAGPRSIVAGAGVSARSTTLDTRATYLSVRGPITAQVLARSGGPTVERFGDPGILIDRAFPLQRSADTSGIAVVRHFAHRQLPLVLGEDATELSVLGGRPDALQGLLSELMGYDGVVTSAMHVMIACHSYGIPCALVTFEGVEEAVHGDGMKYEDYALGVEIDAQPRRPVPLDLQHVDLRAMLQTVTIADEVKDRVQAALDEGVAAVLAA